MTGYKKALRSDGSECIVHLLTHESFLLPPVDGYQRTSFATVIAIYDMNGNKIHEEAHSWINPDFKYLTGAQCLVNPYKAGDDALNYVGIYFFSKREEALSYEIPGNEMEDKS